MQPPFASSWEQLQERRFENILLRQQKDLPRAFHNALLELSARTNTDERFRNLLRPTLNGVQGMVQDAIQREVDNLLESYGTEYWDDRDVTYDNLIWGTSGIEIPIKRILFQVELIMQESVSKFMPEVADVMAAELTAHVGSARDLSPVWNAPATARNMLLRCLENRAATCFEKPTARWSGALDVISDTCASRRRCMN